MRAHFVPRRVGGGNSKTNKIAAAATPVIEQLEGRALRAVGAWDPTFGGAFGATTDGAVVIEYGPAAPAGQHSSFDVSDVLVQPDGKIVTLSYAQMRDATQPYGWRNFVSLDRLTAAGVVDPTFGVNGRATLDIGSTDYALGMFLTAGGKIVVGGHSYLDGGGAAFTVTRLNADGSRDATFGNNGVALLSIGSGGNAHGFAVGRDGSIVLSCTRGATYQGIVTVIGKFNPDGTPDTRFGGDGIVETELWKFENTEALAIQDDGSVLFSGMRRLVPYNVDPAAQTVGYLARLTPSGELDQTFGAGGVVNEATSTWVSEIVVQPDGKILTASSSASDYHSSLLGVKQYNADGTPDRTFGPYATPGQSTTVRPKVIFNADSSDLHLLPDGKILAVGTGRDGGTIVVRYRADGQIDATFGLVGYVESDTNGRLEAVRAAAIAPDGSMIFVGENASYTDPLHLIVRRLEDAPPPGYAVLDEFGRVIVTGTRGNDHITVEPIYDDAYLVRVNENEEIFWLFGFNQLIINCGAGDDLVILSPEILLPANINGGEGNDTLVGGFGNDSINGNAGKDRLDGGYGNDRLAGNGGNDAIVGSDGADRLYGDLGNDRLESGQHGDKLYGGDGADLLGGGQGSDALYGGAGADTLVGGRGAGYDRGYDITDIDVVYNVYLPTPVAPPPPLPPVSPDPLPTETTQDELALLIP